MLRLILTLLMLATPATVAAQNVSEKIVTGLSQRNVSITATFDGTGILVYGAVKREAPAPSNVPLDVVIEVSGPPHTVTVRRKARRMGIWINTDKVEVSSAPSYYAVASTGPLREILSETEDVRHKIRVDRLIRNVGTADKVDDPREFSEAIVRIRQNNGLYRPSAGSVELTDETLFRADFDLPANLTEGDFRARIFLVRNKAVVDKQETYIKVRKVGLERWIYNLAHQKPLIYGLLSLTIAIIAGWGASAIFRILRLN